MLHTYGIPNPENTLIQNYQIPSKKYFILPIFKLFFLRPAQSSTAAKLPQRFQRLLTSTFSFRLINSCNFTSVAAPGGERGSARSPPQQSKPGQLEILSGQVEIVYFELCMSSGQTLGVKAQRFRGHTSPHRNVKEKVLVMSL
eukprot:TRINITY_DN32577_c0_g2_i4.p2 TRINITY_DN32577_c0_g2~~TRINITY_DN32577_c0_g2_i4.p2  ORF type:complete len:143 (+),score=22.76 TRINITY_DN32577_c0_g2_i4:640-1068(+)